MAKKSKPVLVDIQDVLATISVTMNEKGQFLFSISGSNDGAKQLSYTVVAYARQALNKVPEYRNKLVFDGENLDRLH